MRTYYIKKNGLFLKSETVTSESDYWEVSEIIAEHKTHYSWTDDKEEAKSFMTYQEAKVFLAKKAKQSFFNDAIVD